MPSRSLLSTLALGAFLGLAFGSMPSEEELAVATAEKEAKWAERKQRLGAAYQAVASVRLDGLDVELCDSESMGAKIDARVIDDSYGTVELEHASLDFMARFASPDPSDFTTDRDRFYWLTSMVMFSRFDDLAADGLQPAESDWERVIDELWEQRYLVVFAVDETAPNVAPAVLDNGDGIAGFLQAAAFVVELETAEVHCQGLFQAQTSEEVTWREGAVLTDGSFADALESDFAGSVTAAVSPLMAKPLGIEVRWWR